MEATEDRMAFTFHTRISNPRSTEKMRWDTSTIDKLLYLVNSIVLLVCGVVLMFIIKPLDAPHKSINCVMPVRFSGATIDHAQQQCLSSTANLSIAVGGNIRGFGNHSVTQAEIFPSREVHSDFTTFVFLMAILSLLPIVCWRLVGTIDGRDFLTKGNTPSRNRFIVMLWFLITKVATAALCAFFVVLIIVMRSQADKYLDVVEYHRQPEEFPVLCSFKLSSPGVRPRPTIVYCIISKGQNAVSLLQSFEHGLDSVVQSLQVWLISLFIINIFNLITTTITVWSLSVKSSRVNFIQRHVPDETDSATCDKIDDRLGLPGAIVFNLAAKLGHGGHVKNALTEFCSYQN